MRLKNYLADLGKILWECLNFLQEMYYNTNILKVSYRFEKRGIIWKNLFFVIF